MARYRIVVNTVEQRYYPQKKVWYWPFWRNIGKGYCEILSAKKICEKDRLNNSKDKYKIVEMEFEND